MATGTLDAEILIIGAGATGLALAQGLRSAGISCIVFERDETTTARVRDWNMGLHWGAPILRELIGPEAWSRIQGVQVDPNTPTKHMDGLKFVHGSTGDLISEARIDYFYRLKRSALRQFLAKNVDIRFGKQLVDVEMSSDGSFSTAKFKDGSCVTGRLVVGADGPKSRIREIMLGPAAKARRIPFAASFVQAKYTKEQALFLRSFHPLYIAAVHPENKFAFFGIQDAPDADNPETWTFFFYISFNSSLAEQDKTADWTVAQRLKQAKDMAKTFADPWKSAYEWLPDNHSVWYFGFTDWDPSALDHRWDNRDGSMTLAGDAAHVMTFQRGQGLNHSLADAAGLLKAIKKSRGESAISLKEAVAEYENEVIQRAGEEVQQGTKNTGMLHDWELFKQSPVFQKGLKKE